MSATPSLTLVQRTRFALGRWRRHRQAAGFVHKGKVLAAAGQQDAAIVAFRQAFDLNALTPLHVYEALQSSVVTSAQHVEKAETLQLAGDEKRAAEHYALAIAHAGHYRESVDLDQLLQQVVVDNQVVITQFAINYFPMFEIWYRHFKQCGGNNLLVIALDPVVYRKVRDMGVAAYLLPVFNFQVGIRDILWLETVKFRQKLIECGVDYVHSDLDAVWFENPLASVRQHKADIVASIGYGTPKYVVDAWGFVMCLGFYQMRSNEHTRKLYPEYIKYTAACGHDQNGLNTLLLERGTHWRKEAGDLWQGSCDALQLQLTVLPDSMISRQETVYTGDQRPLVVHPLLEGKSMVGKLAQLARAGIT